MTWIMWLATAASLVGTVGVNRKRPWGQAVWMATNVVWIACYVILGIWPSAALFCAYFVLASYGFAKWLAEEKREDVSTGNPGTDAPCLHERFEWEGPRVLRCAQCGKFFEIGSGGARSAAARTD